MQPMVRKILPWVRPVKLEAVMPAILILKLILGFAPPLEAQNPISRKVQSRLRRGCTFLDLHNENCCCDAHLPAKAVFGRDFTALCAWIKPDFC
jgi:hypothetical protein